MYTKTVTVRIAINKWTLTKTATVVRMTKRRIGYGYGCCIHAETHTYRHNICMQQ